MQEKPIVWVGSALRDLRQLPPLARRRAGRELHRVQLGLVPTDWKPVKAVGRGVRELRIRVGVGGRGDYRVFYVAKHTEAVYVLHVFEKKSMRTSRPDVELGRNRFQAMEQRRTKGD